MATVGQTLVQNLVDRGVEIIFGIPGVHTIELYRGIENADIRHITPRHEQGAGFMADGYARMSGKPGVVFVITGPGLVNTMTPMAQARADSVPMIVVTGVNRRDSLGKGLGLLHELPDQFDLSQTVSNMRNISQVGLSGGCADAQLCSTRRSPRASSHRGAH